MRKIIWFRRDLRVFDNPLLSIEGELFPIFIFDTNILKDLDRDDKRVNYIFNAIVKLKAGLKETGLDLKVFFGTPEEVFDFILMQESFEEVVACGDYDSYAKERDRTISHKIHFRYLQDTYIFRHDEVLKDDGSPYLVFTPFYKKARKILENKDISAHKKGESTLFETDYTGISKIEKGAVSKLKLEITGIGFIEVGGESLDPCSSLENFKKKLDLYQEKRDFLDADATSHLSIALRFGTVGVREVLREIIPLENSEPFVRQLIFRDYYAYLLFHIPRLEFENYKYSFSGKYNQLLFDSFCNAKTGVPIVDAGVRELKKTGRMHNRVRMITASFFTKDLLLPWQLGEAFFAKYLLDFDKASNVLSWQWSAGTGVDPQPFFRIFNPYLQSKKFDKEGHYITRYLPQLKDLPKKYLHDETYLLNNDLQEYPKPVVVHKEAVTEALKCFRKN